MRGYISEPDVIEIDKINKDPYYQEFLSPHKLRWFAGIKISSRESMLSLSIQRTIEQGRFSDVEMATLAGLSAALSGPAALARAIGFARAEGAIAGFEASGSSVLLLDGFGNIVRYNASVEKMLGPDLLIRRRRLVSTNKDAQAALERVMHDVIWNTKGSIAARPVTLPRRASLPVVAYVLRLDRLTSNALDLCQACIVLDDLNHRGRPAEAVLRSVFALTGKEARIAAGLSTGAALSDLADEFGISYETARNHLKSVMAKTGTRRQTELVAMLVRFRGPRCER